ncbi:peptidase M28 [Chryseobacterium sp. ERMR1:04]|nr:peptidase M28 [Chryseobacterium sp. ERMR1:04]
MVFFNPFKRAQVPEKSPIPADINLVKEHLRALTQTPEFRNYKNLDQLNTIAEYIHQNFNKYSDNTSFQEYQVGEETYKNVICSFGTENKKRIIIGAHYDVCGDQQGADDNATGVTALLELARMLKGQKLNYRIDLVAYTLEEPPYFRTENMGSYVHAKYLKDNNIEVYGMASVEMIGYFKDEDNSQDYPLGILSWYYGNRGDYITLAKKFGGGEFVNNFSDHFVEANQVKTETFSAPQFIKGTDYSDHLNYWKFGYSAMMITDTSFFRNKNYHQPTDTLETLDLKRMTKVIDGIFLSLIHLQ